MFENIILLMNGTHVTIYKPSVAPENYWCYKKFTQLTIYVSLIIKGEYGHYRTIVVNNTIRDFIAIFDFYLSLKTYPMGMPFLPTPHFHA